ncbi:MAG: proline--tRNA ligase, partial [Dehalococcoidia bacterium]
MADKKLLKSKSENISDWYNDVVLKAELADYAPVKGCMVIRPYGYALWESVQSYMDKLIKDRGVENSYFPLFIPMSYLQKEKDHVEGFSPQLAVVTHGGGKKLVENLAVRPTSETIMYEMFKRWTSSWKQLPILLNQWCNIVRWEKRTYLFLRTTEFLWQEGHCAHLTHQQSQDQLLWAINMYQQTYN